MKWTTIKVPESLAEIVREEAERQGIPMWKVIERAIMFKNDERRSPKIKELLPLADKLAWYVAKLAMSVGAFKENPTRENYNKLYRTVFQIEERFGLNLDLLLIVAEEYLDAKDEVQRRELLQDINAATKIAVMKLIERFAELEEKRSREGQEA